MSCYLHSSAGKHLDCKSKQSETCWTMAPFQTAPGRRKRAEEPTNPHSDSNHSLPSRTHTHIHMEWHHSAWGTVLLFQTMPEGKCSGPLKLKVKSLGIQSYQKWRNGMRVSLLASLTVCLCFCISFSNVSDKMLLTPPPSHPYPPSCIVIVQVFIIPHHCCCFVFFNSPSC